MVLIDATTVCGPGAVGPDARIHTKVRVADVAVLDASVTDASGGETFKRFGFEQGELAIADRLYCNPINVTRALEQGADVLVRYNRGSLPLSQLGRSLDALATVRTLRDGSVLDLPVSFEHDD